MKYLAILLALFLLEIIYFKLAGRFNILDHPNHRTMHKGAIVRGGGMVFYLATVMYMIFQGSISWYVFGGLSMLAIVSFVDDLKELPSIIRFFTQALSIILLLIGLPTAPP